MDQIVALIDYLRANPRVAVGVAVGILAIYLILQRRSRIERDAEQKLASLRQEKTGRYNSLRPPH
jgi:hypothetical protein